MIDDHAGSRSELLGLRSDPRRGDRKAHAAFPVSRRDSHGRQSGGEILFIEATQMPGSGHLTLTGQIGDVMKESATTAFSIVRSPRKKVRASTRDVFANPTCTSTCRRARFPRTVRPPVWP